MSATSLYRSLLAASCLAYLICLISPIEGQLGSGALILLATLYAGVSDIGKGTLSIWNISKMSFMTPIFLLPYYNALVMYLILRLWRSSYIPSRMLCGAVTVGAVGFSIHAAWLFLIVAGPSVRQGLAAIYAWGCVAALLAAGAAIRRRALPRR